MGLVLGAVWWWAVLRLVLVPGRAGLVEGAVAAGGWGLSLLPVHVAARGPTGRGAAAGGGRGAGLAGGGAGVSGAGARRPVAGASPGVCTGAPRRRRWGKGSGRS
nr:hypothetical protein [Streptomyces candidus]